MLIYYRSPLFSDKVNLVSGGHWRFLVIVFFYIIFLKTLSLRFQEEDDISMFLDTVRIVFSDCKEFSINVTFLFYHNYFFFISNSFCKLNTMPYSEFMRVWNSNWKHKAELDILRRIPETQDMFSLEIYSNVIFCMNIENRRKFSQDLVDAVTNLATLYGCEKDSEWLHFVKTVSENKDIQNVSYHN